MPTLADILKYFKQHLQNHTLDFPKTYWEAHVQHADLELIKLFLSNIKYGHNVSHLEILKTPPPKPYVGYPQNIE